MPIASPARSESQIALPPMVLDPTPATAPTPTPATPATPTPLYRVSEVDLGRPEAGEQEALAATVAWVRDFLGRPHPELGRSGPVCPFVPRSLQLDTIYLTVVRTGETADPARIESIAAAYRDVFLHLEPNAGEAAINKALMMVFPGIPHRDAPRLIDAVQRKLKPSYLPHGLMLGEFHAQNDAPGLRNPDFRPLRSPLPMLVIRHMVEADLPFLGRPEDPPGARAGFLRAYLHRVRKGAPQRHVERAIDALVEAEIELRLAAAGGAPAAGCPFRHQLSGLS